LLIKKVIEIKNNEIKSMRIYELVFMLFGLLKHQD
jgi:hypothetical protein